MTKALTAKVKLEFPITISGVEVDHLTMRRPKVRDEIVLSKSKGDDADKELGYIASLCEVAPEDLHELDSSDYQKLLSQLADFRGAKS